jgi:anti-sigma factor RsiW
VVTAGWLADIADYHAVYAAQGRHLVEVGADESDHIETWLGNTIGAAFSIPDLSQFDLTFEGGRLLVANGKPVAQLMYRDADGAVVALCLQQSATQTDEPPSFNAQTINGFDFVSWRAGTAQYVVIGEGGAPDLADIAAAAAVDI